MSAEESEASSKDTQIGNKEQQEQTTRSGLVVEEEDQEDHLGRKDREDHVDHVASLVDHAASLADQAVLPDQAVLVDQADQAATMTMTMVVVDQVGRAIGSSAHKAPIQREPTRHRKHHEMRSADTRWIIPEALVRVHSQRLLHNRGAFFNL